MPRVVMTGQRNDMVFAQFLQPGFLIAAEADVLEVISHEVVESVDAHGFTVEYVEVTLASLDGTVFDRTYPIDHLVPTVPRAFQVAA